MIPNKIYTYGYTDGKKGLEARYMLTGSTLYVKIPGSDHWSDYLRCLFAWPRVRPFFNLVKLHPTWSFMARKILVRLKREVRKHAIKRIEVIGHSMGGAVAAILMLYFSNNTSTVVTLINAPKCGNKAAMWALRRCGADIHVLYDQGDIVHKLPLFYCNYPLRSRRWYARSYGWGKAHNNMPREWEEFPI